MFETENGDAYSSNSDCGTECMKWVNNNSNNGTIV